MAMDEVRKIIHILEHQESEVASLEKAVVYFDSDHKPDRDHYVVATFLKCLGIDFKDNEITPNPVQDHPVDIYYKIPALPLR